MTAAEKEGWRGTPVAGHGTSNRSIVEPRGLSPKGRPPNFTSNQTKFQTMEPPPPPIRHSIGGGPLLAITFASLATTHAAPKTRLPFPG